MATNTVSINVVKWAYIDQTNPDTHYTINHNTAYEVVKKTNQNKYLLFGLDNLPSALKRYRILGVDIYLNPVGSDYAQFSSLEEDFNANTVTWNQGRPAVDVWTMSAYRSSGSADAVRSEVARAWLDPTVDMDTMQQLLQNRGFACMGNSDGWYVKTKRSNGGTNMVTVTYDSEAVLYGKPVITKEPTGTVDPRNPQTFEWEIKKHASNWYCMDEIFHQVSARFYWKLRTDEEWTVINLTDEMTVTIPADTWPTATTVQWYVETTDEDGNVASTSVHSFQTPTNLVHCTEYPRGSEVDTRRDIVFEWSLSSVIGEYDQESATLYWRKSENDPWNTITVGSAKRIVVPALTFPTYSTITWYLEATDTGGHTAVYEESKFTTPTVKISPLTYPEGSDISTKIAQRFAWVYSNSRYTDYSQASATFFWQKVPSETWNSISISGNVKSITFPANTFPTSSTIRWYILGTDVGGTTTKTTAKTFNTVTTKITPQNCPTSGYQDPRLPITFNWYYSSVIGDYTQQSAVLYWRETGDEEWNEIPISGDIQTLTVPANTFPVASEIEWYLAGTDTGGTTTTTGQFSFSTTASTAYAVCTAPVGQVEDGTKPITFVWIVKNDDGSLPLRTLVEWKYDTESQLEWKTLLDTVDTDTEFTVPAETFHAGAVEWRVSAFNRDLIQGPENAASFVCLMAPEAPAGLAATPVPRTTVRWQASGQEAYEVVIDGKTVAKEYGPGIYSYQQKEPLEDGEHTIAVRVQGPYSLWSNWSTTTIMVENDPQFSVTLSGVFDVDAELVWETDDDDPETLANVYRDGKRIAAVGNALTYTDRLALGEHSYYVEIWDKDGNYARSNAVAGVMETEDTVIAELGEHRWQKIHLTEASTPKNVFSWSQEYAVRSVLGSEYPVFELGKSITLTGNYSCSFTNDADARQFEELRGKTVVVKSNRQNLLTGVMVRLDKSVSEFYTTYSFSLQQIGLEDFINNEASS